MAAKRIILLDTSKEYEKGLLLARTASVTELRDGPQSGHDNHLWHAIGWCSEQHTFTRCGLYASNPDVRYRTVKGLDTPPRICSACALMLEPPPTDDNPMTTARSDGTKPHWKSYLSVLNKHASGVNGYKDVMPWKEDAP